MFDVHLSNVLLKIVDRYNRKSLRVVKNKKQYYIVGLLYTLCTRLVRVVSRVLRAFRTECVVTF